MPYCNSEFHEGDRWWWSDDEESPLNQWCTSCNNEYQRRYSLRARGVDVDPPRNYIPIADAADRLGISKEALAQQIRRGKRDLSIWQRTARGNLYVNEEELEQD